MRGHRFIIFGGTVLSFLTELVQSRFLTLEAMLPAARWSTLLWLSVTELKSISTSYSTG
jgi:hypothetical protein